MFPAPWRQHDPIAKSGVVDYKAGVDLDVGVDRVDTRGVAT